jgi:PPK2 family polyphosphate:nucleotide phosphotransferase
MEIDRFRVKSGTTVDLDGHPTDFTGEFTDKAQAKDLLEKNIERLSDLQDTLYAQNIHSLLVIFQAMDAAGKDSAIEHVMSGVNPQGCQVVAFKAPSAEELDHDYLWRCQVALPERGKIGIFNRSHYEEVLVVRVHPEILKAQQLPDDIKNSPDIWQQRYRQIREWERTLTENRTAVLKFFLHVSKEEQKKRFLKRIQQPEKNWKFSARDVKERELWNEYMDAYRETMQATSTDDAPWYIIPADKKWFTRLAVSEIMVEKLESMNLTYPQITADERSGLEEARRLLESGS